MKGRGEGVGAVTNLRFLHALMFQYRVDLYTRILSEECITVVINKQYLAVLGGLVLATLICSSEYTLFLFATYDHKETTLFKKRITTIPLIRKLHKVLN